ncbi:hypothetical protein [Aliikangiella coralliicola]|uniref:Uncharacterized protein n=1 Tax=Aliikangiella coralliicola TaxID=2592383 RepID=A0A545UE67_9GAMM|nr:hypothetical protein [Aliikangiella coralliicola]TQV87772.1 hypothetical protein FLL46_10320 [Aliikangiella coralliicola]
MSQRVALQFYRDERHRPPFSIRLPELTGQHELSTNGVDTQCAVSLVQQLFKEDANGIKVDLLTASDRDGVLAALHRECWGDKIVSSLYCEDCDDFFDLSFTLSELQRHLLSQQSEKNFQQTVVKNATVQVDQHHLSIPVSSQETVLGNLPESEGLNQLLKTCCDFDDGADGGIGENTNDKVEDLSKKLSDSKVESIAAELEQVAPILDLDLDATCPDCNRQHQASFDIQSFVLQRLLNEKERLLAEVHLIALNYGWSLQEILSLPRKTRKSIADLIEQSL